MRGNNVLGIVFSNADEQELKCLSESRTMGAIPFGGRYRLIDFTLSNMVNSGINKVGVVTKGNYKSILNHLGSGKNWNLSKKNGGLYILPPFGSDFNFENKIKTLYCLKDFLVNSKEEYVLLCDCNVICNINYKDAFDRHIQNNADITIIYTEGRLPKKSSKSIILYLNKNEKVKNVCICNDTDKECNYGMNMFILKKNLLNSLILECVRNNNLSFERCIIQQNIDKLTIFGYKFNGFSRTVTSVNTYFDTNMLLLNENVRSELFNKGKPIYTKAKDDVPARYNSESKISNCLMSNGCEVNGQISNSVVFRGVKIGKHTKISNCILMQNCVIEDGCTLNYVIADKNVIVKNNRKLMGYYSYPIYIEKAKII